VALRAIWAGGVALAAGAAVAQPMAPAAALGPTPVGLWRTIDDETRTEKSLVRIFEQGGAVHGRIEKLLDPAAKPQAVCELCTDERKGQAVLGLTVLRNLKVDTDDKGLWTGGDVLDPNNGKVYRARLKPVDGGRKLELRGYIGPFYRTQVWQRVE
jgi:uncharacterized protein (DUF2147 family)